MRYKCHQGKRVIIYNSLLPQQCCWYALRVNVCMNPKTGHCWKRTCFLSKPFQIKNKQTGGICNTRDFVDWMYPLISLVISAAQVHHWVCKHCKHADDCFRLRAPFHTVIKQLKKNAAFICISISVYIRCCCPLIIRTVCSGCMGAIIEGRGSLYRLDSLESAGWEQGEGP